VSAGNCLCQRIRFEVRGSLGPLRFCHCTECRRATGSAFSANAGVAAEDFEILEGRELIAEYELTPGTFRAFCSNCGAPVYARLEHEPDSLRIRLGTLNDAPEIRPEAHVWVSEQAPWFEISDALPQLARDGRDG